jgi:hypothetical protein
MKRLIQTCSFIGLLLVLMVSAQAQVSKTYRVQIPFDFNIGQESYQAGTYQVSRVNTMLLIRNQKTNDVKVLATQSEEKGKSFETPHFYFNRVEDKNMLVEVAGKDFNVKLDDTTSTARDAVTPRKANAQNDAHVSPPSASQTGQNN